MRDAVPSGERLDRGALGERATTMSAVRTSCSMPERLPQDLPHITFPLGRPPANHEDPIRDLGQAMEIPEHLTTQEWDPLYTEDALQILRTVGSVLDLPTPFYLLEKIDGSVPPGEAEVGQPYSYSELLSELLSEICLSGPWSDKIPDGVDYSALKDSWYLFLHGQMPSSGLHALLPWADDGDPGLASAAEELHQNLVAAFAAQVQRVASRGGWVAVEYRRKVAEDAQLLARNEVTGYWIEQFQLFELSDPETAILAEVITVPSQVKTISSLAVLNLFEAAPPLAQVIKAVSNLGIKVEDNEGDFYPAACNAKIREIVHLLDLAQVPPMDLQAIARELRADLKARHLSGEESSPNVPHDFIYSDIPHDLTSQKYASLYTLEYSEMLGRSLPYNFLLIRNSKHRERLSYIFKRYLRLYLTSPKLKEFGGTDAFCEGEFDFNIACRLLGDEGLRKVTRNFNAAFEKQAKAHTASGKKHQAETDQIAAQHLRKGDKDSLRAYCLLRMRNSEDVELLAEALNSERLYKAICHAIGYGVREEDTLRQDWDRDGPVSKYLRRKLKKGDRIVKFFQSGDVIDVVMELEKRGVGHKRKELAEALLESRKGNR
ncbi:hypothetical protein [Streptomyces wuyuanensis]|uniref:hypothetical protein n=1 Tax=Streptomyces wuyuanensis TaxID=1196353 RepID=UPI00342B78C1